MMDERKMELVQKNVWEDFKKSELYNKDIADENYAELIRSITQALFRERELQTGSRMA